MEEPNPTDEPDPMDETDPVDVDEPDTDPGEWETILETPFPGHEDEKAASSSTPLACHGAWATPAIDRIGLAPGCRIQRREPSKSFQVFFSKPAVGFMYSKTFRWSKDRSMEDAFADALQWSWQQ